MKARIPARPTLLLAAVGLLFGAPARGQCPTDAWQVYAATGDVMDIETVGQAAWIAAIGGLIHVDLTGVSGGNPAQFKITDNEGLVSTDVSCMTMDGFGNVWVGTREDGASVFDPAGNHIRNLASFDEVLWSDRVLAMDAAGTIRSDTDKDGAYDYDVVYVSSANRYTPSGSPQGGGFMTIRVKRYADGWGFEREGFATILELVGEILVETDDVWLATAGRGLFRSDVASGALEHVLPPQGSGLLSSNVKKLVRAPDWDQSGNEVLWLGTGAGLQTYDGSGVDTVTHFEGRNILDLWRKDDMLWILAQHATGSQSDLYQVDLTAPFDTLRIPRAACLADTNYVPREIAVDAADRIVLGTKTVSYAVREGVSWFCPRPLGPPSPRVADLALGVDGTVYFGTGAKTPVSQIPQGLGIFDGGSWGQIVSGAGALMHDGVTEVELWTDGTIWFGTSLNRDAGGLHRLFPGGAVTIERYHDDQTDPARDTQGRNVADIEIDGSGNLWIAYGQAEGGLSVIEALPSETITNFPFEVIGNAQLRSCAFDLQGRVWVSAANIPGAGRIGHVYVLDHGGTLSNTSDDVYTAYNVANDIFEIETVNTLEITSQNRIWLAGETGLAVGDIDPGTATVSVTWSRADPSAAQAGGRNPLPYTVSTLDWDENLWLGTESAGLVRISPDGSEWTWFDTSVGCPLPDLQITGLHADAATQRMYVGTASGGMAVIDLSGRTSSGDGDKELDPIPYPNPFRPANGVVTFSGIPPDETTTMRIYDLAGDLVLEMVDVQGPKGWDGRNTGSQIVESGVYLVTAESKTAQGATKTYEGKIAVIR